MVVTCFKYVSHRGWSKNIDPPLTMLVVHKILWKIQSYMIELFVALVLYLGLGIELLQVNIHLVSEEVNVTTPGSPIFSFWFLKKGG